MKTILKKASAAVMAFAVMGAAVVFDVPGRMTAKAVSAEGGCDGSHTTAWDNTAVFLVNGDYYLDRSLEIDAQIDITGDVTLCLNGNTIAAVNDTRIFNVKNGGTLTVCDCTGRGKIIGGAVSENSGNNNGGVVYVNDGGTFILSDGKIKGGLAEKGGGVYVHGNGTFKMYGGEISGNRSKEGGGVYLYNAAGFEMSGGKISDNTAGQEGGGVYVNSDGVFEMTGGEISGNTAEYTGEPNNGGGGVYTAGTFTMSGKSMISDNTAGSEATGEYCFGGGVCVSVGGDFTMSGGTIKSNKAKYGAGVYVSGGTFEMTDGTIGGANVASNNGGGVCVGSGASTEFKMSGGTISGNTAKNGGGVEMSDGTFEMTGGKIDTNTATGDGGGAYVRGGKLIMSDDGAISGNAATNGGGVFLRSGEFTMSGGAISNNTADQYGLGVYVDNKNNGGGKITLNGTVDITSPKKADGVSESNVYLRTGKKITIGTDFEAVGEIGVHPEEDVKCDDPVDVTEFDTGVTRDIEEVSEQFKPDILGQKITYDNDMVQLTVDHVYGEWSTDDTYHWHKCINCSYINPNDKAVHAWSPVTIDATCLEDGSITDTCSVCGLEKESETIPATGHAWGEWTIVKEPTTTEKGKKERVCKNDPSHIDEEDIPMLTESDPDPDSEPVIEPLPDPAPDSEPVSEPAAPVTSDPGSDSSSPDSSVPAIGDSAIDDSSDSNSSNGDNGSTESGNTDNNGGHENASPNPSTGIAISLVPLAAAVTVLTVVIKRKKK